MHRFVRCVLPEALRRHGMLSSATNRQASSAQAQYFSYGEAANPIRSGLTGTVPYRSFSPAFFSQNGSAVMPLDLSEELQCSGPATGPSLCANFIRLDGDSLRTSADATSQLFFVARRRHQPSMRAYLPLGSRRHLRSAGRWGSDSQQ